MAETLWKLEAVIPGPHVDPFEDALAEHALSVSRFEVPGTDLWRVTALFPAPPDLGPFTILLTRLADAGAQPLPITVSQVPETDWVGESLKNLKPVTAGRFFVCGHHDAAKAPANAIRVLIEAGPAFGTGHHETTRGCLLALELVARRHRPRRPLDLGCGSGVLAIAMAKAWRVPTVASDIDPAAVRTTVENADLNGVSGRVRAVTADGFRHRLLHNTAPYDLIVANILAGPLRELAPTLARHLSPGGYVILSGLLAVQEREVAVAFGGHGLIRWRRVALNGWVTLILHDQRRVKRR